MADETTPAPAPVKVEHGRTAVVTQPYGNIEWMPQREAKKLLDDGKARRATERDLRIAGVALEPPVTTDAQTEA